MTEEEKILAYVERHGSINNTECRDILSADPDHTSYLLKKLHEYGLLVREGDRRWARYRLPEGSTIAPRQQP
jgi:DNA-binding MarR family transcriptional regulator